MLALFGTACQSLNCKKQLLFQGCTKLKCSCRQVLDHCTLACKCQAECSNAANVTLSKPIRHCFLYPEQETTGLLVKLIGSNYCYRMELVSLEKNAIHATELLYETLHNTTPTFQIPVPHIEIFISKSPCFHQDCEPRCDVLHNCESQRACARLLSIAYGQIQRHLNNCNIQMTVKFLAAYVRRGDLYTQQVCCNSCQ